MSAELLRIVLDRKQVARACGDYASSRVSLLAGTYSVDVKFEPAAQTAEVIFTKKRVRKAKGTT